MSRSVHPLRSLRPSRPGAIISTTIAGPVQALINEFSKLPTIGPKTAARLVFHLLNRSRDDAHALAEAIVALKERVRLCSRCFRSPRTTRARSAPTRAATPGLICVVADAKDVFAVERTSAYNGRYHVLGGLISPMDGIGPAQLRIKELVDRIAAEGARARSSSPPTPTPKAKRQRSTSRACSRPAA